MTSSTDDLSVLTNEVSAQQKTNTVKATQRKMINLLFKYSAIFWFIAILLGQWFFFYYIMAFYGFSVINDNIEIWNRWEAFGSTPFKVGDTMGNTVFAVHAIGAGIVAFGGALQLVPKLRALAPKLHKINGYIYLVTVFGLAISGFYLTWVRGASTDLLAAIGTSVNGFLILGFAYLTVKTARAKQFNNHRKWAVRLFLVSNAQWFLRVGVFSYLITGTMLGGNPAFGDIFFTIWTFACFLLPLAMAELYFIADKKKGLKLKLLAIVLLVLLTVLMSVGVVGLTPFLIQVLSGGPISL